MNVATITVNQNEAPATAVTERKAAKPSSMRLSQETHAALEEAKRRLGAHSWDECFKSLLDGSASVTLYAADYPSRSEEVRQMGMLLTKTMDLFKLSWTLSSDTEARVTQEMRAIIAEKDNTIATLKEQLAGEADAREELQKHIEKLEVDLDMIRRERDTAQLRADTLAQANELSALIKSMQSVAKTTDAADASDSNTEQDEPPAENEMEELSPEEQDALDEYDNMHPTVGTEPPF